jgi:hypothetical protein
MSAKRQQAPRASILGETWALSVERSLAMLDLRGARTNASQEPRRHRFRMVAGRALKEAQLVARPSGFDARQHHCRSALRTRPAYDCSRKRMCEVGRRHSALPAVGGSVTELSATDALLHPWPVISSSQGTKEQIANSFLGGPKLCYSAAVL